MTIATEGKAAAVLVLADLNYPGWLATVDGKRTPVFEVDGVLRGVLVPPGSHTVEYQYLPASWFWGALMSAIGVVLLLPLSTLAASVYARRARAKLRRCLSR